MSSIATLGQRDCYEFISSFNLSIFPGFHSVGLKISIAWHDIYVAASDGDVNSESRELIVDGDVNSESRELIVAVALVTDFPLVQSHSVDSAAKHLCCMA